MRRTRSVLVSVALLAPGVVPACGSSNATTATPVSDGGALDATSLPDGGDTSADTSSSPDAQFFFDAATPDDGATPVDAAMDADGAPTADAGVDGAAPVDAGVDGTVPADAAVDGATPADAGADAAALDAGRDAAPPADSGGDAAGSLAAIKTVFTILLENHDYAEVVGSPNATYINSLIAAYGLATNYNDSLSHPSLPNYLYLVSGATQYLSFGFLEPDPTAAPFPVSTDNLGNQLTAASVPWRSYQESMGAACTLASNGNYVPRHDPFPYFSGIQNGGGSLCANTNVDYGQFAADLAAGTYRYMWITPNLLSDGHDPALDPVTGLKQSDAWLSVELPKILASAAYKDHGVVFLTWDEAEGRGGDSKDQVPMIVISPDLKAPGITSSVAYSHASYLATVETIFGLPKLGDATTASVMTDFFP